MRVHDKIVITVATTFGPLEVIAIPFGEHVAIYQHADTRDWTVVHIASGQSFAKGVTKKEATMIASILSANFSDAVACTDPADLVRSIGADRLELIIASVIGW